MDIELKVGDRVRVRDGYGEVQSEAVVEITNKAKAIVFVREHLPNGTKLRYGCPISAVEPLEIDVRKEG